MADLAQQIRAKLDSMVEGSGNLRSCAGCEGDCYCQTWIDYQNALAAVLELHAPIDGGAHVCAERIDGEDHYRATEHVTVHEVTCPTLLAIAKGLGIEAADG